MRSCPTAAPLRRPTGERRRRAAKKGVSAKKWCSRPRRHLPFRRALPPARRLSRGIEFTVSRRARSTRSCPTAPSMAHLAAARAADKWCSADLRRRLTTRRSCAALLRARRRQRGFCNEIAFDVHSLVERIAHRATAACKKTFFFWTASDNNFNYNSGVHCAAQRRGRPQGRPSASSTMTTATRLASTPTTAHQL